MNKRIIIVDDNELIRICLVRLLQNEGYETLTAQNGREALKILQNSRDNLPCLVLTDLMMPEMDGRQLIEQLKKDDVLRTLPVVMFSAMERPVLPSGVPFLKKPIEGDAVIELVRRFCGPSGQR